MGVVMSDVAYELLRQPRKDIAELREEALTRLERRGYDVRGKTPGQIRQILRRRPTMQKSEN